jgi:cellulose synthase/poly-beta-1,6-N-acetylglucosamine synthase-like glycosyltransferase
MMDLPRATLVLLSYNQAQYIREAVRGALSQDYPRLQIVISDDRSRDETFAIIQDEISAFTGPHEVLVRQPTENLGLIAHLYDAVTVANGELIVVAAGDDISRPHRVSRLVDAWLDSKADALFSDWDEIDGSGRVVRLGRLRTKARDGIRLDRYFPGQSVTHIMGTTAAYAHHIFEAIPQPTERLFAEDFYFTLMLALRGGRIVEIPERLVAYRRHEGALTHKVTSEESVDAAEQLTRQMAEWQARQLRWFRALVVRDQGSHPGPKRAMPVDDALIAEDLDFVTVRARWDEIGLRERLSAYKRLRFPPWRRWMLPRLLGKAPLRFLKHTRRLARKAFGDDAA